MIGGLVVAKRGFIRIEHIVIGAVLMGITFFGLAFAPGVATAGGVIFLSGMATILYMTATTAIIQIEARRDMYGRVLALQTVIMGGTRLFGGSLIGWFADLAGGRMPFVVGGAACLLAVVYGFPANRTGRTIAPSGSEPRSRP